MLEPSDFAAGKTSGEAPRTGGRGSSRIVLTLTSVFGLGYAPWAPGTCGTLAALPLWWATAHLPLGTYLAALTALTVVAVWLSARAEQIYGAHDVQRIVIDEVVGFLVTVVAVPCTPLTALVAFVVFRLLDAGKPGPIGWVDRHVGGGLGVVMDDVAAGGVGCVLLHGAHAAGALSW